MEMKKKYSKYDATKYTAKWEEFNKLKYQHDEQAFYFYNDQPYVEYQRNKILHDLGECHTMISCLSNLEDKYAKSYK